MATAENSTVSTIGDSPDSQEVISATAHGREW
jgi:hypothetical protein